MPRLLAVLSLVFASTPAVAGPKVVVVVGPKAPKLERFAADEVAAQFKQLFDAEVMIADTPPAAFEHLVLIGSPATNPAVAKAVGDNWTKLTDQGHLLRSVTLDGRGAVVAGGGSPVATLWAACELGHHFGIRPFLHGDLLPEKPPALMLDGIDMTFEPAAKVRAWYLLGRDPAAFGRWGLADHKLLFRQLAKLKFNRVAFNLTPENAAALLDLQRFPVSGDTPGRKAFKGAKEYDHPDLAGKTDAERRAAAVSFVRGIMDTAAEFGLDVGETPTDLQPVALRGFLPRVPADFPVKPPGFVVIAEVPADLSPAVYHLARLAFDPKLTAKAAYTQFLTPGMGAAATERVVLGFAHIEEAAALVAKHDPKFMTLSPELFPGLVRSADAPPEWWKKAGKLYAEAMDEIYRGIRATYHDPARPLLLYYAKRCEFAVHYFVGVEAARLAGVAKAKGDKDTVVQQLEKATESVYNALNAYGDVARDPSDRGVIAALAQYAYRPLKAELKAADKK